MSTDDSVQLYINNLSFATTEAELSQFVADKIGQQPLETSIVTRRGRNAEGRSRGFGFIRVPAAKKDAVIGLNGSSLGDREIGVVEARERTERPPRQTGGENGENGEAAPRQRKPRKPRAKKAPAGGDDSAAASGQASRRTRKAPVERKTFENATQLYVNNLHFDVTSEDLESFFEGLIGAKPLDVDIVTSKFGRFKGRSRGFGFVTVPNDAVSKALTGAGKSLKEREIGVQEARERELQQAQGGEQQTGGDDSAPKARRPRARRPRKPAGADGESQTVAAGAESGEQGQRKPRNRRRGPKKDGEASETAAQ